MIPLISSRNHAIERTLLIGSVLVVASCAGMLQFVVIESIFSSLLAHDQDEIRAASENDISFQLNALFTHAEGCEYSSDDIIWRNITNKFTQRIKRLTHSKGNELWFFDNSG